MIVSSSSSSGRKGGLSLWALMANGRSTHQWFVAVGCVVMVMLYCVAIDGRNGSTGQWSTTTSTGGELSPKCAKMCNSRDTMPEAMPLDTVYQMRERVEKARETYVETLRKNYGAYYDTLFVDKGMSRGFASISGFNETHHLSRQRFQRKLLLKVLEASLQDPSRRRGCDCSQPTFVWSCGGHSAAAGHGNPHNESYTAFLTRAVSPILQEVGVSFVGRNYAMGGMPSGAELALCLESVHGLDADVITWDFGMTDVPMWWKKAWYSFRTALHRNRPAMVDLNLQSGAKEGDTFPARVWSTIPRHLEPLGGVPTFRMKLSAWEDIKAELPDMFGMSSEQINRVPPYVRHFKCQDRIEDGDPTCKDLKYTVVDDERCDTFKSRVSWHPGWRFNAIMGNLLAFFVVDNLIVALHDLQEAARRDGGFNPPKLLERYRREEDEEYERLYSSLNVTEAIDFEGGLSVLTTLPEEIIGHAKDYMTPESVMCRTALLPSQSRYLGHVTERAQEQRPYTFDNYRFDLEGVSRVEADHEARLSSGIAVEDDAFREMALVWGDEGHHVDQCPELISIDAKDYFYSNEHMGWTTLSVPNAIERSVYLPDTNKKLKGIVMVCNVLCNWGKCPDGEMREDDMGKGLMLRVNGVDVEKMIKVGDQCYILQPKDGRHFPATSDGVYQLQVRVQKTSDDFVSFYRISSVVIM